MDEQMLGHQVYERLPLGSSFPFGFFKTSDRQAFFHYHDCLELNIVERGTGYYIINGKRYDIAKGDIFVINNKEPHMAVHGEDFGLAVIVFDIELLWRNKGISRFLSPFFSRREEFSHKISADNPYQQELSEVFDRIGAEYNGNETGREIAVEALLMYMLTLIYRCYDDMQELDEANDSFRKMYARISVVLEYISAHFKEEITLGKLSEEVSLNSNYLCKCFKKVTGRTIFVYIEQMRVQYGCFLLKSTDKSITQIAMDSGFNSVNYFNRVFKKHMEMTPGQFRRRINEN